jgi:hypothetical protein
VDHKVQLGLRGRQVLRVVQAQQVLLERKAEQDQRVPLALKELLAIMAQLDLKVFKAIMEPKVLQALQVA